MRKRAEKILWQIIKEEIPPEDRWACKSDIDFIEAELTAAVKEEREKWEGLEAAAREVLPCLKPGTIANEAAYNVLAEALAALLTEQTGSKPGDKPEVPE